MFTPFLIAILMIFTELFTYLFLSMCSGSIKHCSTSKTYRKGFEKGIITPNEFKTIMNKEEKKDENN